MKGTRRNIFGWSSREKAERRPRLRSSLTVGQASKAAFLAGRRLGDSGYFEAWLRKRNLDDRSPAQRDILARRFAEGAEARQRRGTGRTLPVKPAAAQHRKAGADPERRAAVRQAEANLADARKKLGAAARKGNQQAGAIIAQYEAEVRKVTANPKRRTNPKRRPARGFTIGATKAELRKAAPHIAQQYSRLWDDMVRDVLDRFEKRHRERMSEGVYDEMFEYGVTQVRKLGLPAKANPGKPGAAFRRCVKAVQTGGLQKRATAGRKRVARTTNPDRNDANLAKAYAAGERVGKQQRAKGAPRPTDRDLERAARKLFKRRNLRFALTFDGEKAFIAGFWTGWHESLAAPSSGKSAYDNPRKAGRRNPTVKIGNRKVKVSRKGARIIRRLVAHDNLKAGRRNPDTEAADMYRMFHGKDPDETVEYITEEHEHRTLWGVGDLVEMTVVTPKGDTRVIRVATVPKGERYPDPSALPVPERVVLAASEDGRQLYMVSGNQELDTKALGLAAADVRDNTLVGVVTGLVYQTKKKFHKFETTNYTHRLGEETGFQPVLVYHPRTPSMEIVGGRYRIERPGIID